MRCVAEGIKRQIPCYSEGWLTAGFCLCFCQTKFSCGRVPRSRKVSARGLCLGLCHPVSQFLMDACDFSSSRLDLISRQSSLSRHPSARRGSSTRDGHSGFRRTQRSPCRSRSRSGHRREFPSVQHATGRHERSEVPFSVLPFFQNFRRKSAFSFSTFIQSLLDQGALVQVPQTQRIFTSLPFSGKNGRF